MAKKPAAKQTTVLLDEHVTQVYKGGETLGHLESMDVVGGDLINGVEVADGFV